MQWTGVIRDETLIETDITAIFVNCLRLERTNQLNLLPDKDLVDLCPHIEPYQVTKNQKCLLPDLEIRPKRNSFKVTVDTR
jgi:hypothetical protein